MAAATAPRQTRPRKTAAEKAQIEYDKATKRMDSANERVNKMQADLQAATDEQAAAERYLDYVSRNPDLPAQPADSIEDSEGEPSEGNDES